MPTTSTQTRNADSKGRLTLGDRFANRTVLIEDHGSELIIRLAKVIPEQEAWLYENKDALTRVRRGLKQAREGRTTKGPDLAAAKHLADSISDNE